MIFITGEPVYKVFMVTSEQGKTEINLGPEMIQNLTKAANNEIPFAENILTISSEVKEPVVENNITIPEDGVASLRAPQTAALE